MLRQRIAIAVIVCATTVAATGWVFAQQKKIPTVTAQDRYEIHDLLMTNHTGYDFASRDNADMWVSTFTPDAVLDNPPSHVVGLQEIRAFAMNQYKTDPKHMLRHWTSTFHVTPNAEGAILSAFYVTMRSSQGGPMVFGASTGRYESQVIKTRDGWRIKHHVIVSEGPVTMFQPPAAAR